MIQVWGSKEISSEKMEPRCGTYSVNKNQRKRWCDLAEIYERTFTRDEKNSTRMKKEKKHNTNIFSGGSNNLVLKYSVQSFKSWSEHEKLLIQMSKQFLFFLSIRNILFNSDKTFEITYWFFSEHFCWLSELNFDAINSLHLQNGNSSREFSEFIHRI